jgi:hypothetical protein
MRPPGEISVAILSAAERLAREVDGQRHGPTLQELARAAQVATRDAMNTVKNLTRSGKLEPVAERRVAYRNRPVAEYAPRQRQPEKDEGYVDVAAVFSVWAQG